MYSCSFLFCRFVVAKIDVNGAIMNVIGTHLQADDQFCKKPDIPVVRASQLQQISTLVNQLSGPSILAGDLNVPHGSEEFYEMTKLLGISDYKLIGPPSFDTKGNSIAFKRYGGNEESSTLDYVVPLGFSENNWVNEVVPVKMDEFCGNGLNDFSDHYPIIGYAN